MTHTDPTATGVRVQTPTSEALNAYLCSILPAELGPILAVVALGGKHALPDLPAFMGRARVGWLLDAPNGPKYTLWSKQTERIFEGDRRLLVLAFELYARAVLEPWEGLLPAEPGGDLTNRAPAWVDGLRQAHIPMLSLLRRAGMEPMMPGPDPKRAMPLPQGIYGNDERTAELHRTDGPGGSAVNPHLRVEDPVLSAFFDDLLPLESANVVDAALQHQAFALRALPEAIGGRRAWTAEPTEGGYRFEGPAGSTEVALLDLQIDLELLARAILAPFEGLSIASVQAPKDGAPAWIGRLRLGWGELLGPTAGHRLQLG